jgi:hypothetical protein
VKLGKLHDVRAICLHFLLSLSKYKYSLNMQDLEAVVILLLGFVKLYKLQFMRT